MIKTIQTYESNILSYFKFTTNIFQILKVGTHDSTSLDFIIHKKKEILAACNNIYMTNQRMKAYFIDFSFIQNLLSFVTNVAYDLLL
jgi:hypothetical protein